MAGDDKHAVESVERISEEQKKFFSAGAPRKDQFEDVWPEIEEQLDQAYGSTFRIGSYTIGYTRDIKLFRDIETGIGANFTAYSLPSAIKPYYGSHPVGSNIYLRFRLKPAE